MIQVANSEHFVIYGKYSIYIINWTVWNNGGGYTITGIQNLFVDAELFHLIEPLNLEGVQVVRIDGTGSPEDPYEKFLAAGSPEAIESWLEDEEETISINYTSGTTGNPKGVMYTYRGAYLNA